MIGAPFRAPRFCIIYCVRSVLTSARSCLVVPASWNLKQKVQSPLLLPLLRIGEAGEPTLRFLVAEQPEEHLRHFCPGCCVLWIEMICVSLYDSCSNHGVYGRLCPWG